MRRQTSTTFATMMHNAPPGRICSRIFSIYQMRFRSFSLRFAYAAQVANSVISAGLTNFFLFSTRVLHSHFRVCRCVLSTLHSSIHSGHFHFRFKRHWDAICVIRYLFSAYSALTNSYLLRFLSRATPGCVAVSSGANDMAPPGRKIRMAARRQGGINLLSAFSLNDARVNNTSERVRHGARSAPAELRAGTKFCRANRAHRCAAAPQRSLR